MALANGDFRLAASHFVAGLAADPYSPDAREGLDSAVRRLIVPRPRRLAASEHPLRARRYFISDGYASRLSPEYRLDGADAREATIARPDVYARAAEVAERLGARRIVDLGTGDGHRLMALHPRFELLGIDYGPNLELARRRFPHLTWMEHDLDRPGPLPLTAGQLEGAVVICANVIEQLVNPEFLLGNLRALLPSVEAVVLSTPERDASGETASAGPPAHAERVREWTVNELAELLAFCEFDHGDLALVRSAGAEGAGGTILAVLVPDAERAARIDSAVRSAA